MKKSGNLILLGVAMINKMIVYSILLYIFLENTIPGGGLGHLTMAQVGFVYNLIYIIPIVAIGIWLICKGFKIKKYDEI